MALKAWVNLTQANSFNPNKFSHKLGLFQNFKLFFFFFDLILGIILIHLKGKAMKVTQGIANDFFALTNTIFSVLVHQRNHTWEEENCGKLLQDIVNISKNKKMYFMGSITMLSIE